MTARLRQSPSGPAITIDSIPSDDVVNESPVPGESLTGALDALYGRSVRYLDLVDDPIALWNFDDTLAAVRGPALDTITGQYGFTNIYPGVRALMVNLGARLSAAPTSSLIRLGAMSAEVIVALNGFPLPWVCGVGGSGAGADNNASWSFGSPATGVPRSMGVAWQTGNNVSVDFATNPAPGSPGIPTIHNIMSLGFSRSASGVVQPYLNGKTLGPPSAPLPLPTSGGNGVFSLGTPLGGTSPFMFVLMSAAVYDRDRSASEFLGSYNRSMGHGLGFVT